MHLFYEPCLLLNSTRRGCSPQLTRDDKVTWGRWPGTGRELSLRSRPCTQGPRSLFCMQHLLRGCLLLCEFLCWHIFSLLLGTNLEELLGHMVSLCLSFLRNVPDCFPVWPEHDACFPGCVWGEVSGPVPIPRTFLGLWLCTQLAVSSQTSSHSSCVGAWEGLLLVPH